MDQNVLNSSSASTATADTNAFVKRLKSRIFRGFYVERRYVDNVKSYRDIVCLHKSEKSLDKLLQDIREELQLFYGPQLWIGITSGILKDISISQSAVLETYLWVEMEDLAFGQYWFSIRGIRFRGNEIILKLNVVQPVKEEETTNTANITKSNNSPQTSTDSSVCSSNARQVNLNDFMLLLQQWWVSTKQTVYDFMANDISKENIKGLLQFLALFAFSLLVCAIECVKYLGIFSLRFMFELSRLTVVLTPIILKIIEMFGKIVGGFYILLAMIWKGTVGNRNQPKYRALEQRTNMRYDYRRLK